MAESNEVVRIEHDTHGAYRIPVPGADRPAVLTWVLRDGARAANHAYVPHAARGRGLAARLVDAMIADARRQGFKIEPKCSYVVAAFKRHPEWSDVLAKRAESGAAGED